MENNPIVPVRPSDNAIADISAQISLSNKLLANSGLKDLASLAGASRDETLYLLSTEANRKHLSRSIAQLDKGNSKAIKTEDLWK